MKPVQILAFTGLQLANSDNDVKQAMDAKDSFNNLEGAKAGLETLKSFATGHPIRALGEFAEFAGNMSNDAVLAFSKMVKGEMSSHEFANTYVASLKSNAATVGHEIQHVAGELGLS